MTLPLVIRLANHVAHTRPQDVPADVMAKAVEHSLDTLGVILAGADAAETAVAVAMLRAAGETGAVPLAGQPGPGLVPRAAALVHGIAAHAYELDDTGGCDHSGAVVWPALLSVLALAEAPLEGRRLLTAVVLGYDVGRRVLLGFGGYQPHNAAGWHSTGTCGAFGAAAAAAHALGLDAGRTANALGLAASMAAGSWAFIHDGAMAKRLHAGHAAQAGLTAALLAQAGMTGPAALFEDVWGGFFGTHGGPGRPCAGLMEGLGRDWRILDAAIKPHASCRDVHAAVDAIARVQARTSLHPEMVRLVRVRLNAFLAGMVGGRSVDTLPAAQMSLPYGVAAQICHGTAGLEVYGAAQRADPAIRALLDRVEIVQDASVTASWASTIEIILADGGRIEEPTCSPLGSPDNPVSGSALRAKFDGLARRALPGAQADRVAALVAALPDNPDARPLLAALAG
ncbi:MAG: MmgE/PrpD family protein [Alkalilacustris sp.]